MSAAGRRGARRPSAAPPKAPPPEFPLPPVAGTHPALIATALLTAAVLIFAVTYRIFDIDLWHNLAYGRAVLSLHRVPPTQMWTWPTWGQSDVNTSWLFRVKVAALWNMAGIGGLFAWRWLSTLAVFGFTWATARRLGARGFTPLFLMVAAVLAYRLRAQIRPETLATLLFAATLWILETRRGGGRDHSPWLIAIAWVWINSHLTYHLLFLVAGIHLVVELVAARGLTPPTRKLFFMGLAALAATLINPFGWHALAWPFQYFFTWRAEPFYRDIAELQPLALDQPAVLLLFVWPALALLRARRRGADAVELLLCALLTLLALGGQRFVPTYTVGALPFVARDLDVVLLGWRRPERLASVTARAGAALAGILAVALLLARDPGYATGIGIDMGRAPVDACDYVAKAGIRGKVFNDFPIGGYLLYRFWPDRERLPFLGCLTEHSTARQRQLYHDVFFGGLEGWTAIDREYRFDWLLLMRQQSGRGELLDRLDADSTWALVFADDASAIYLRRDGALAALAAREGYRVLGAGRARLEALDQSTVTDSVLRAAMVSELRRQESESRATSEVSKILGYTALVEHRFDEAQRELRRAAGIAPRMRGVHLPLAEIALAGGDTRGALAEYRAEYALEPRTRGLALRIGQCLARLGHRDQATAWYHRELKVDPNSDEAGDSLLARPR